MNLNIRVVLILTVSLMATHALSQDLSGWSDKTVCRVAKEQPKNEDFKSAIDARGLSCIVTVSKAKSQGVIAGEYNTRLLPQYHKYKNIIKTPLRGLKVPSGFTLVDDYTSFMNWHSKNTYDNMRDTEFEIGYQSQFVDPDVCVDDLISTITYKSLFNNVSGESDQITTVAGKCHQMTSQRFSNNPKTGIIAYKRVLTSWLNEGTLKKANKYRRRYDQPYDYALRHSVSNIMTHYAVYHRSYKFTPAKHADIVSMFEQWITTYKAYPGNDRMDGSLNVCDLKNPHTGHKRMHVDSNRRINQDHCGSLNARMAVSGIYFGLEFNSQVILDSGIRYTEMFMAIMDKNKMYSSQISRGLCAMSYADQMSPIIDQLDYALNKAYDIDFVNLKNIHGVTLAEVWYKLYEAAMDPKQLLPYYNLRQWQDCQPHLTGGKSLVTLIEEKNKPAIWGAFRPDQHILRSPKVASTLRPKLWNTYDSDSSSTFRIRAFAAGNSAVGISPLVLRKATGWKAHPNSKKAADKKAADKKAADKKAADKKAADKKVADKKAADKKAADKKAADKKAADKKAADKKAADKKAADKKVADKKAAARAERIRRREMLFALDGKYNIQFTLEGPNLMDVESKPQKLGQIEFTLHKAQPKFDTKNPLYDDLGLDGAIISLDYDGSLKIRGVVDLGHPYGKGCINLVGNINSEVAFKDTPYEMCKNSIQLLQAKFKKMGDKKAEAL